MATYALTCVDKPDSLAVRLANREEHLAYVAARKAMVRLAGPLLDDGGDMTGSLLILEAADRAEAEAFAAGDPYARAGLFERVELRALRISVGAIA